jgi:hypothetical protein
VFVLVLQDDDVAGNCFMLLLMLMRDGLLAFCLV